MDRREEIARLIAGDLLEIKAVFLRPEEPLHGLAGSGARFIVITGLL